MGGRSYCGVVETFSAPARTYVVFSGDERTQLESWLDFYRGTLLFKCDGLTPDQLRERPIATSTMSLLGLLRHLTFVEQIWFEARFAGREVVEYYKLEDDREIDFRDLDSASVEEVLELYLTSVSTSRALAKDHELDEKAAKARHGIQFDLRWIYLHMIEEYARHCGHADLIRELVDGTTGY
jgi:uncharacterized damage-inducible protein DinB